MIPALFVAALVLLALIVVPVVVVSRIFDRLANLQRQVDILQRRLEGRPRDTPVLEVPKVPAQVPEVPKSLSPEVPRVPEVPPVSEPPVYSDVPEPAAAESLETIIGSRWLLYIGVVAIVIGVGYFDKLAFDHHWVRQTAR